MNEYSKLLNSEILDGIEEIRQKAIDKAIASMSYEGYKILKEANSDFDAWVDSIIRAKLYDLKKESK